MKPERLIKSAIEQGLISAESDIKTDTKTDIEEQKPAKMRENMGVKIQKPAEMRENDAGNDQKPAFPTMAIKNVYDLIFQNPKIKQAQMAENLGLDDSTIERATAWLKANGYINKEHSKVKGVWQLL